MIFLMENWGPEEIKSLRVRFKLTQLQLSQRLGVTRVYVMLLEKGVKTPSKTLSLLLSYVEKDLSEKQKGGS